MLKQRLRLWILPFALSLGFFSTNVSHAQTNAYWDVNGVTNGQGGSGTWTQSSSGTYWTTNSVNADANSGGPIGGGLYAVTNGAASAVLTNSGNYIFNFGGTAGTVNQGATYQGFGVNFLTSGYIWTISSSGANGRTITTTNAVNLGANALTLANGTSGLNSFTFAGPTSSTGQGITGTSGSTLTLRNLVADSAANSFGVYVSGGGTISSNIAINVDIGTGSKILLGSQSSGGAKIDSAITLNTNASGVALDITNSASGTVALNGVVSGASGLVLNNSGSGKIILNGANTYAGGTTVGSTGTGDVRYTNSSAFGTGTVTISDGATSYLRATANATDLTNAVNIGSGATLQLATTNSGWKSTWSGVISGAGGINYGFSDSGLYLTGTNSSFGGGVNVSSTGTLYVNKLGNAGENSSIGTNGTITISTTSVNQSGIRWTGTTNEVSDKSIVLSSTGGLSLLADGATNSSLTIGGNITTTGLGSRTLTFAGYNTNTLTLNGLINENGGVNSVTIGVSSSGTVVLGNTNNSFSGAIRITNSTSSTLTVLSVANIGNSGSNSALGRNGTINMAGTSASAITALRYTGTGETSDKVINFVSAVGGAILDQSGAGNLKFTSPMTATGVGAKAITLQGSTSGTGEIAGAISDLGGVTSLTKSGTGAWILSGSNSYTGNTTIAGAGGILRLMSVNSLSPKTVLVGSGSSSTIATLDLGNAGDYVANSYGSSSSSGSSMFFSASSGSATTLTFTNAANFLTRIDNTSRSLTNNSANLNVIFNGTFDIGSSGNNDCGVGGVGNFTFNNSIISSGTGTRGLIKGGDGSVFFNASNSYNGPTTISAGILSLGASAALGTNSVVLSGGTMRVDVNGTNESKGNLTLTGNANINLGTVNTGQLRFASATNWTASRILTVANSSVGAKLYITDTNNVQTSQIKSAENPTATASLASDGLLTFSVPSSGSTYTGVGYAAGTENVIAANGLSNLMNYAFGQNGPTESVPAAPVLSIGSSGITLSATARTDDSSLRFYVEWTSDLSGVTDSWDLHSTEVFPSTLNDTIVGTIEYGVARKFLRLKVTKR